MILLSPLSEKYHCELNINLLKIEMGYSHSVHEKHIPIHIVQRGIRLHRKQCHLLYTCSNMSISIFAMPRLTAISRHTGGMPLELYTLHHSRLNISFLNIYRMQSASQLYIHPTFALHRPCRGIVLPSVTSSWHDAGRM